MTDRKATHAGSTLRSTAAVVLAAGAGSRFSDIGHKLLARHSETGPTVLERALSAVIAADIGPVIVVTGALDLDALAVDPNVERLLAAPGVTVHHNPDWADGQAGSIGVGLNAARAIDGIDSVVVGLADQPMVTPDAWRAVADGLGSIVVATYDGRRGNPVKLHTSVWGLLPASGDEGARVLMRGRPDLVVEVPCSGSPADIDTVEDLHRWQNN